ncbi:Zn-ribbon domain-containing OB-fold protein [Actinomadura atramentaria]|uniref:Zn-ribbon domain-containing OB-fold protein n=1 Tax=Actinomadura atramentaria TaxID=1990 RepID=UPI00037A794D|nr:OB-fold domain-containing protein [Actinomadura atramentaria]
MSLDGRPRPGEDRDSAPWWKAVREHELLVQECGDCGRPRFPARAVCNRCRSLAWTWRRSRGTGRVYSWVVNHRAFLPGLADEVPYTVVLVRLDEGAEHDDDLLFYGDLVDFDAAELREGLPVEAVFTDVPGEPATTLVRWRPRR